VNPVNKKLNKRRERERGGERGRQGGGNYSAEQHYVHIKKKGEEADCSKIRRNMART
jgi:hypothetical protein